MGHPQNNRKFKSIWQWQHLSSKNERNTHAANFHAHIQHEQLVVHVNHYSGTGKKGKRIHVQVARVFVCWTRAEYGILALFHSKWKGKEKERQRKTHSHTHTRSRARSFANRNEKCASLPHIRALQHRVRNCSIKLIREMDLSIKAVVYSHTVAIEHSASHAASLSFSESNRKQELNNFSLSQMTIKDNTFCCLFFLCILFFSVHNLFVWFFSR